MALVDCPECTKSISSSAETCPHCGCPISPKQTNFRAKPSASRWRKKPKLGLLVLGLIFSLMTISSLVGIVNGSMFDRVESRFMVFGLTIVFAFFAYQSLVGAYEKGHVYDEHGNKVYVDD